jgi:L-threonylcarbamoyladenylate synthase
MQRISIDASKALGPQLESAVRVLRSRGVVGYPTDTLYGLAADPRSEVALDRLRQLKGRAADKTVALVAASLDQAREVAVLDGHALILARRFWPGPLTLVVPARQGLAEGVRSSTGQVGVRVPANDVAQALAQACGFPITATSANVSGAAPTADPDEVMRQLPALEWLIDAGRLAGGPPSTLVQVDGEHVEVLREGAVSRTRVLESLVPAR